MKKPDYSFLQHVHIYPYKGVWPTIDEDVFIAPGVMIIGDVTIRKKANIWYGSVLRGDVNYITIGENVNIQDGTIIHVATYGPPTIIEDNVSIGHCALIHACHIKKHAFIGMKACVMDKAVIEEEAFIAAGALIAPGKIVPKKEMWAGVPAKKMRNISAEDKKLMEWTYPHYVTLAEQSKKDIEQL